MKQQSPIAHNIVSYRNHFLLMQFNFTYQILLDLFLRHFRISNLIYFLLGKHKNLYSYKLKELILLKVETYLQYLTPYAISRNKLVHINLQSTTAIDWFVYGFYKMLSLYHPHYSNLLFSYANFQVHYFLSKSSRYRFPVTYIQLVSLVL